MALRRPQRDLAGGDVRDTMLDLVVAIQVAAAGLLIGFVLGVALVGNALRSECDARVIDAVGQATMCAVSP